MDSISTYGADFQNLNEQYAFSYYEGNVPPIQEAVIHKDWWGYYNSSVNNLLPYQQVSIRKVPMGSVTPVFQDIGTPNLSRSPNLNDKKVGMIKSITYPTGGQTEFIYENNRYEGNVDGPGLRVKEIITNPINGPVIHKLYKYGINEDGIGKMNKFLIPGGIYNRDLMGTEGIVMHYWTTETLNPLLGDQVGFRTRNYLSDPYLSFKLSGSPIKYDIVTEYYVKDGVTQHKTQTGYDWAEFLDNVLDFNITERKPPMTFTRKLVDPQYIWEGPKITSKVFFSYLSGEFDTVKSEIYEYNSLQMDEAWDMPTYLHTNIIYTKVGGSSTDVYIQADGLHNYSCSVYGYAFRHYTTGKRLLSHTETKEYSASGVMKTDKYIGYTANGMVQNEHIVNSKSVENEVSYNYPQDYPTNPIYSQMVLKNIISPVISSTKTVDGVLTKNTLNNYYNPTNELFVPRSVEVKNGSNPQEVLATFNQYDAYGNILEQQKVNDTKISYIWGYAHKYPVAEVVGSDYESISSLVDLTKLENAGNYSDIEIRAELDKIRTGLSGSIAQVTTYTFAPLIGMTSKTDPQGNTTFYDYDNYGRLTLVRDNGNNILNRYCYDYAGNQTENCSVVNYGFVYKSRAISKTLNRNNCEVGYDGGSITYTVPAGKYTSSISQADADQKAQNDIDSNAQNYANLNGTCIASTPIDIYVSKETGDPENQLIYEITFTPLNGTPITFYPEEDSFYDSPPQVPAGQYQLKVSVEGYIYDNTYDEGYGNVYISGDWPFEGQCQSYGSGYNNMNDYFFNVDLRNTSQIQIQLGRYHCN